MQQNTKEQKKRPNRGGRPPKRPEDRKTVQLKIWVTEGEAKQLKQAAKDFGFKNISPMLGHLVRKRLSANLAITPGDMMNIHKLAKNSQIMRELAAEGEPYNEQWHRQAVQSEKECKRLAQLLNQALNNNKKRARK